MKLLIALFFASTPGHTTGLLPMQPAHNLLLNNSHLHNAQLVNSEHLTGWKAAYFNRADRLLLPLKLDTRTFLLRYQNASTDVMFSVLNSLFDRLFVVPKSGLPRNEDYLSVFLTTNSAEMRLSQFVLDTALACHWMSWNSSIKTASCKILPQLIAATTKLAYARLLGRGQTFQNSIDEPVHLGRGLVLSRALVPVLLSLSMVPERIQRLGSSSHADQILRHFLKRSMIVFTDSTFNFFAHLAVVNYSVPFARFKAEYNIETAVQQCRAYRIAAKSKIERCANNHLVASTLGRLMVRAVLGGSLQASRFEFTELLEHGLQTIVHPKSGELHVLPSDRYRTFERKGITYSLLQLDLMMIGVEVLQNNGVGVRPDLRSKLYQSLDFMAKLFSRSTSLAKFVELAPWLNPLEFNKYINRTSLAPWARNLGPLSLASGTICREADQISALTDSLCKEGPEIAPASLQRRMPSASYTLQESVLYGPSQLLFGN